MRQFKLSRYQLHRFGVSVPVKSREARKAAKRLEATIDHPETQFFTGFHPYTVSAEKYVVLCGVGIPEGDTPNQFSPSFHVDFQNAAGLEPLGVRLTRDEMQDLVEAIMPGDEDFSYIRAEFHFAEDEYESPLVSKSGPERELALDWDMDVGPFVRSGIRYSSPDGINDILIDATPGPLAVNLRLLWRPITSFGEIKSEIKSVAEFVELLVRPRPSEVTNDVK